MSLRLGTSAAIGWFQRCVLVRQYNFLCHGDVGVECRLKVGGADTANPCFAVGNPNCELGKIEQNNGVDELFEGDPLCSCSSFRVHHAGASRSRARCLQNSGHQIVAALLNVGRLLRAPEKAEMRPQVKVPCVFLGRPPWLVPGAPLDMTMRPTIVAAVIQGPPESAAMTGRFLGCACEGSSDLRRAKPPPVKGAGVFAEVLLTFASLLSSARRVSAPQTLAVCQAATATLG